MVVIAHVVMAMVMMVVMDLRTIMVKVCAAVYLIYSFPAWCLKRDQFSEAARPAADRTSDLQSGQIKSLILEAAQSLGR